VVEVVLNREQWFLSPAMQVYELYLRLIEGTIRLCLLS
jgi:hypothetical protein